MILYLSIAVVYMENVFFVDNLVALASPIKFEHMSKN